MERLPLWLRLCTLALAACEETQGGAAPTAPEAARQPSAPPESAEAASPGPGAVRVRTLPLQGGALHALEAGPGEGALVLLLHGARYSANTWKELGTLVHLAKAGYHAVAIDWPGFGATPAWSAEPDPSTLLTSVCDELGAERAVLVAPSMGGRFAFDLLESSASRVSGLVAIAPAGADAYDAREGSPQVLLLWGERDEIIPLAQGRALATRLGARLEVFPTAAHPCYLDQPERFHAILLEFLASVAAAESRR